MDGLPEEGAKGLAAPLLGVKAADLGQSELDLNERLNLARKNSRTMAAMSPPNSRLGAKSVSELRSQVETRSELVEKRDSKLAAKSIAELRRHDTAMDSEAEAAVRQAGAQLLLGWRDLANDSPCSIWIAYPALSYVAASCA